ncbi:uncharacterized protein YeaO (DUF488 family) [Sinomonas atrocyanea]|uniref:DUF488 domain-containing protein n=1 Tax=Sinomonas atrocyanea TaxID=37927 RepID=UPI00277F4EFA|nr:DUF488 family protein [Sinomonas atrocyanea]MDP9883836.1 uncharacterized protein YeaO (DUF488 family) [Sinomonas atrocyanea]
MGTVGIRRVYEPSPEGTFRILVDRIWPRGLSKDRAGVDLWLKDVGPSDGLRMWFGHDPARFEEFAAKYRQELDGADAFDELRATLRDHDSVDLVYSAKDTEHNQAVVLAELLRAR